MIQGKIVAKNVDVMKQAGDKSKVLTIDLGKITAKGTMILELVSRSKLPPILNGLEVLNQ